MKKFLVLPVEISSNRLLIYTSLFLIIFCNAAFFSNIIDVYPLNTKNLLFLASLCWVFSGLTIILLGLVTFRPMIKPLLIVILCISSVTAYFMDAYNTIIDDSMIHNTMSTDIHEAADLFNIRLLFYFLLLGLLPSLFIYHIKLIRQPLWHELISRLKLLAVCLAGVVATILLLSDFYSSFFREHMQLRFYSNPGYYLYSSGKYLAAQIKNKKQLLQTIGLDAHIPPTDVHRELMVFVVGETARADRFSLNGYERETNPLLKEENIISFSNFFSCATSTAKSVPCMFSIYNESDFDNDKAENTENVLDVLQHAGVNILWIDNNSSSKGVADRVNYISYRGPDINSVCDVECRDEGMLKNLQTFIDKHPSGDILIVLHQMGNHGPAYFKRYPKEFERFTPVCATNHLEDCSQKELDNAYDNAIVYTDYFLSRVIALLKSNQQTFETGMFYVSDHGESLGENGLYLHGLPNFIAPDEQRHVPAIIWLGDNYDELSLQTLLPKRQQRYSHDNIFHTLLGFMEIESSVYDQSMDILHNKP